jgi:hypothetical protein
MSADGPTMILFSERIKSFKSAGIDEIWMIVSGFGDFSMANLLGFLDSDLILILKTTDLIISNNSINKKDTWGNRTGIPIEWDRYSNERWCRFKFESKHKSSPSDNNSTLLNNFIAAKAMNGFGGARR